MVLHGRHGYSAHIETENEQGSLTGAAIDPCHGLWNLLPIFATMRSIGWMALSGFDRDINVAANLCCISRSVFWTRESLRIESRRNDDRLET